MEFGEVDDLQGFARGMVSLTGEPDPVAVDDNRWLGRAKGARS